MQILDNINTLWGDDLKRTLKSGAKLKIAASCFSIYAYEALKKELVKIDSLEFIFTAPAFVPNEVTDKFPRERKEFHIPKQQRERNLYGSEFEIQLKNKLTQRAIAKECADWIRRKATFRSNSTKASMQQFSCLIAGDHDFAYMPLHGFTAVDLGYSRGDAVSNFITKFDDAPSTQTWLSLFNQIWNDDSTLQDVTDAICTHIDSVYKENSPEKIGPTDDAKLQHLIAHIKQKIENPINSDNKKVLLFTAFADTANYLYENLATRLKEKNIHSAKVTGSDPVKTTLGKGFNFQDILCFFSPRSKDKELLFPDQKGEIDLLIGTDCISEGQNLQDCDYLINYDIHWNPVRIIQRFGRIDRIGSPNESIQLVNYWPDISLDEYIKLKERVENRMMIVDVTASGDDNVLSAKANDITYRKEQLRRLQEEVIELEDLKTGVNITDLGLNDFRMDLLGYIKNHGDLGHLPSGLHAVVPANPEIGLKLGVIFTLRNRNANVNINQHNRLHPYYLIYIGSDGEVITDHTQIKPLLDLVRSSCKGLSNPIPSVFKQFNDETQDGRDMAKYSDLLGQAIRSMIEVKEDKDIDSLFTSVNTTALVDTIKGLDNFELISFLVVQEEDA